MDRITIIDPYLKGDTQWKKRFADCVLLTTDHRLYLQRRPETWKTSPGAVTLFGGHIEEGETPLAAVIREINEETGARITDDEIIFLGAVSEEWTAHTEIVHLYFWYDRNESITGCYEGEPIFFDNLKSALQHPKLMDYAKWALNRCEELGILDRKSKAR